MKVLKNAEQKNVLIDMHCVNLSDVGRLACDGMAFWIDEKGVNHTTTTLLEREWRLSLNYVCKLKVIYNKEYGYYMTVAVMKDGRQIPVII